MSDNCVLQFFTTFSNVYCMSFVTSILSAIYSQEKNFTREGMYNYV